MSEPATTEPRCVFGMEATNSYLSVCVTGEWDIDMLEGLVEFVQRQRRRLAAHPTVRGPLLCDGWEAVCNGAA